MGRLIYGEMSRTLFLRKLRMLNMYYHHFITTCLYLMLRR